MSTHNNLRQINTLIKYSLFSKPAAVWFLPAAFCVFVFGIFWRLYLGGQQDALFFQILSLGYCWYIYIAGVLVTLNGLRKNSSSFFIDNFKKLSFFIGFSTGLIIYSLTFIFLVEVDAVGAVVVLMYPILFFSISRTWDKWRDISRLSMAGLFPFILLNGYVRISTLFDTSITWLVIFWVIAIVFVVAIELTFYRDWMSKPRNFSPLTDDYAVTQHHYQKRKC